MSERVCFIVNPAAGKGRGMRVWRRLEPLAGQLGSFEVRYTERPHHGVELAREAVAEGFSRVVAVGGDGALSDVANGLVGSACAAGVIPAGTGNDWTRTSGVPRGPEQALRVAFGGRVVPSDLGVAPGGRYFLNIAGVGFDACVAERINAVPPAVRSMGRTISYLWAVVATLRRYQGADATVVLDDRRVEAPGLFLMAVGIARYYGKGMMILPGAEIADGLFDVAWGGDLRSGELFGLLGRIYRGGHVGRPKVEVRQAKRVTIESAAPLPYHLDGDVAGATPVTFEVAPSALRVIVP